MPAPSAGTDEPTAAPRVSPWLRLLVLAGLLGAGALAVVLTKPQRLLTEESLGPPSVLVLVVFTLGYAACSVAMVPRPVMSVAAGALFGAAAGTAVGLAGTLLGAAATFALGRWFGQQALRPLLRGRLLTAADRQLSEHGFRSLLVLRLIPVLPFAAVNHAAAVSRMPWRPFLTATAVGCLPALTAYAVAGSRATEPASPAFLLAVAFLILSGPLAAAWWRRRKAVSPPPPEAPREAAVPVPPEPAASAGRAHGPSGPQGTTPPDLRTDR